MSTALTYLDNAATSWPKPPCVGEAMSRFMDETGANPGRAGHRLANDAARIVYDCREACAELFNQPDPLRVVFGPNVTHALNLAMSGLLRCGDHVVTTSMEHNAVMRPLRALEKQGIEISVVACSSTGLVDPDDMRAAFKAHTKMVVVNHASNVVGTLQPIKEIGRYAREHGALMLVDAAQSAGAVEIDMKKDAIDLLAFTGHKSLCGPMGTGGLVVGERVEIATFEPLIRGGTGSRSEYEIQPDFLPDRFESGTPNVAGLAGLRAGVRWILQRGVMAIRENEMVLTMRLIERLCEIPAVAARGPLDTVGQLPTVSFNMGTMPSSLIAQRLDEEHGVLCRAGLHCAPSAHRTLGTFPNGTVRFALGPMSTQEDVDRGIEALEAVGLGAGR